MIQFNLTSGEAKDFKDNTPEPRGIFRRKVDPILSELAHQAEAVQMKESLVSAYPSTHLTGTRSSPDDDDDDDINLRPRDLPKGIGMC